MALLSRKTREEERKHIQEITDEIERRRSRFRILVCLNGTDAAYEGVKLAARIGRSDECDIILLYVRRIDQGLNSGGLQVRVARQNMLDWGLDLQGITYLKKGMELLLEEGQFGEDWETMSAHTDVFGDPLGDNKVEYRSPDGRSIVLKLKIAVDVVSGILDQYELGPYNLIITGPPKRWRGEMTGFRDPSTVQKVAMLAPSSVLTKRDSGKRKGFLICIDGSDHAITSMFQAAVLADHCGEPITLLSSANERADLPTVKRHLIYATDYLESRGLNVAGTLAPVGDPVQQIIKAGRKFQLICVADSGKSRLKRFVSGSVAFDVMGRADTSVLNVR